MGVDSRSRFGLHRAIFTVTLPVVKIPSLRDEHPLFRQRIMSSKILLPASYVREYNERSHGT